MHHCERKHPPPTPRFAAPKNKKILRPRRRGLQCEHSSPERLIPHRPRRKSADGVHAPNSHHSRAPHPVLKIRPRINEGIPHAHALDATLRSRDPRAGHREDPRPLLPRSPRDQRQTAGASAANPQPNRARRTGRSTSPPNAPRAATPRAELTKSESARARKRTTEESKKRERKRSKRDLPDASDFPAPPPTQRHKLWKSPSSQRTRTLSISAGHRDGKTIEYRVGGHRPPTQATPNKGAAKTKGSATQEIFRAHNSAVECHPHTVEVVGSNPTAPTILSNDIAWLRRDAAGRGKNRAAGEFVSPHSSKGGARATQSTCPLVHRATRRGTYIAWAGCDQRVVLIARSRLEQK